MHLALFQPDIPQNTGTILRLGACMDVAVHVIEPAGFPFSDRALKRAGMDYAARADAWRHEDWTTFEDWRRSEGRRLVLLTTRSERRHLDLTYRKDDVLLVGQESAGAPDHVHAAADARVRIPMAAGLRSLNVAAAAAMALGEALRQTGGFPDGPAADMGEKDAGHDRHRHSHRIRD